MALIGEERRVRLRKAGGRSPRSVEPRVSEWGNPAGVISGHLQAESIGLEKRTWGSETSQYPQERKSKETPKVAASEMG